ncbi:MAG: CsbD family protein [Limnobacter sp.]|nr:CsbD family protein [Limnobacter sp.]
MNKDQKEGRIDEAVGKDKEVTGKDVGNKELEAEGQLQNSKGKVRTTFDDVKQSIKEKGKQK